jgi:hypothetical protein
VKTKKVKKTKFEVQKILPPTAGGRKSVGKKSNRKTAFPSGNRGIRRERISKKTQNTEEFDMGYFGKSRRFSKIAEKTNFFATRDFSECQRKRKTRGVQRPITEKDKPLELSCVFRTHE